MISWQAKYCGPGQSRKILLGLLTLIPCVSIPSACFFQQAEGQEIATQAENAINKGQAALDEAMRLRITESGLLGLKKTIEQLEIATDYGLDDEDTEFAEQMLSDSLMERASTLMQVLNTRSVTDSNAQKIRALVISDLRRVLSYNDPLPTAYLMLAKLRALSGGDPYEARRLVGKFLAFKELPNQQRAEALVLRARLTKNRDKALADMHSAIELAPQNMSYRLAHAVYLRQSNKADEALIAVDELLQLAPEDAHAHIFKGELLYQKKQVEAALACFEKATEIAPELPAAYQKRGLIFRSQRKYDEAISQFNEVLKRQPEALKTLMQRAETYLASGKNPEALADIEVVLEKQPLIDAHRLHAAILVNMNRLDEAIEEMERVSAAIPDQIEPKLQLALYYSVGLQAKKAIATYSDILELDPTNFVALQSRGDSFLSVGKHAEAIADFERALKVQPENTLLLNNLSWVLATSPEDSLRNGKRAVELATQACELTDYKTPHILSTLAAAFAEDGNYESAIKWAKQAVGLDAPEHHEQMTKELESYQKGQPWREKKSANEEKQPQPPLIDTPQDPPMKIPSI